MLHRPDVAPILHEARLAQVAVAARSGPHVTPAAFAPADGRLWLVMSRTTLKVRAIRRRHSVSVLVRGHARSAVLAGRADIISPWGREDVAGLITNYIPSMLALGTYTARNAQTLAGYMLDLLGAPTEAMPHDRVLVSIRPERGMVIEGASVVDAWGRWGRIERRLRPTGAGATSQLAAMTPALPPPAAAALRSGGDVTLGWMCPTGPLALPAKALRPASKVRVIAEAFEVTGAPATSPACITFDQETGFRPSTFAGAILRGHGSVVERRSGWATAALQADRISWWQGFRAGTVR
jgi:hypothetical protein